jgi:hypothetical protein
MSRGTRRAKHRAKQQAAANSREHARKASYEQQRQYTADEPPPGYFCYDPADDFDSRPEFVVTPEQSPVFNSTVPLRPALAVAGLLACVTAACWKLSYTKCMWVAAFWLAVWLLCVAANLCRTKAVEPEDDQFRFTTEEQATRFLHLVFSLYASGQISADVLAEMLRKYQPPGMPEPCICEDCRWARQSCSSTSRLCNDTSYYLPAQH